MAPVVLKRLTALQNSRLAEINLMSTRLQDRERSTLNKKIVTARLDSLNEIWSEARKTHAEIVARDDAEQDAYVINNVFNEMQGTYEDTVDFILTLINEFELASATTLSVRAGDTSATELELRPAKLPKLDLPTFSGRYEDWDSFCDLFTTLVHDAPRISDATKLQYLKSCLTESAADLVKDVATTSANYESTWQSLKARFFKPRLIVSNHLNALMNISPLRKESAVELRSFADESQRIVRALKNLKLPVDHWDIWFIHILSSRLDPDSRKAWESELSAKERHTLAISNRDEVEQTDFFPKFAEFAEFLEKRAQTLSMLVTEPKGEKRTTWVAKPPYARKIFHASSSRLLQGNAQKCALCSAPHYITRCPKFLAKNLSDRRADVRRLRLCFNCLGIHMHKVCKSNGRCNLCKGRHHSLLHFNMPSREQLTYKASDLKPHGQKSDEVKNAVITPGVNAHTANIAVAKQSVLLATAQLEVANPQGTRTRVRALLDQGSEASFITESIVQLLGLKKTKVQVPLTGLGAHSAGTAHSAVRVALQSLNDPNFTIEIDALVLPRLTSKLPAHDCVEIDLEHFTNLTLADPQFYIANSVDLVLGADIYGQLIRSGVQRFPSSRIVAQRTALGWILSGTVEVATSRRAEDEPPMSRRALHCISNEDLNETLERFWTLEELKPPISKLNPENEACERLFLETHARNEHGRYIVKLPLKGEPPKVANETRRMALGSLAHIHRRFTRDSRLAEAYRDFMTTYERLGHMMRVPSTEVNNPNAWYLPHHAVIQPSTSKWKLRVVFDASRRTQEQFCLNDFLMPGPPLQRDLSLILLNWRRYRFVFTADIVKMFRQIRVFPEDQDFQRIVWAPSPMEDPIEYKLTTVTYGTSCAPFLAIRTLIQLAFDEKNRFPLGARCLELNTYVDDTFAGAHELSLAVSKREELIQILKSAGVELDKWAANHSDLLPSEARQQRDAVPKQIDSADFVKTLGVQWNSKLDEFTFSTNKLESLTEVMTKRSVLSSIARLFDPLGWLSPVTVKAKILMQDLWITKCEWDSPLPADARERWLEYCNSLTSLNSLSINRWLGLEPALSCEIHGFSDASSRAYAAAVYLRIIKAQEIFKVSLLAAKTKVAPVKTVSIPNLELCAASLLVQLVGHLRKLEFIKKSPVFLWSDSQIVLKWLSKHPCHWKTFVANRVSSIQTELPSAVWTHVPTNENPADLATRGLTSSELKNSPLWWYGPPWLSLPADDWPRQTETVRTMTIQNFSAEPDILCRFSTLTRLFRVVAYCLRPLMNLRRRKGGLNPLPQYLTTKELTDARLRTIRIAQTHAFPTELSLLKSGKTLPKRNPLSGLNPILDKNEGILRVGGRLSQSNLTRESKHPPILPNRSALSRLYARYAHYSALHGGPTLTTNVLLQHVWVLGRKRLVNSVVHNCVKCQRVKPRLAHQLMGDLPAARLRPARPFTTTGLDYAGPFQIRTTKGRGHRSYKGYIALFVCFVTRAIHLELVSDLTTDSFISAFRRFVSRRGLCRHLYSDNASTFKGADNELRAMFSAASQYYQTLAATLANDGTTWTFIPPTTPHYGGLWEAGVKSAKHHLRRTIGEHTLTFEEFTTVLAEIEACLNSRPLCALTNDIEDLTVLTPAHFLLGETSGLIPDEEPPSIPENRLNRYQLLQRLRNQFWKKWSNDYLQQLQERGKWRNSTDNFQTGQLVLLRDDRYPPAKWPLGRITEVHPGPDGLVRVVTVKTAVNTFRRHIARVCPIHLESEEDTKRFSRVDGRTS